MPDVQEVFDMATQKVRPDPGAMERQHRNQRRSSIRRKVGGYGLAAAIVVAGIVVALTTLSNHRATYTPATHPPPTTSATGSTGAIGAVAPQPVVVSLHGVVQRTPPLNGLPVDGGNLSLSRDGTKVAFANEVGGISTVRIDGIGLRDLSLPFQAQDPAWSPDGSQIAFAGIRNGNADIYVMGADGSNVRRLTRSPGDDGDPSWSPDGSLIVYDDSGTQPLVNGHSATQEIFTVSVGGGSPVRLTRNSTDDSQAAYSPDGTQIAFHREGHAWLMDSNGRSPRELSLPGNCCTGFTPQWSPDGTKIAFGRYDATQRFGDSSLPVVAVYVLDLRSGEVSRVPGAEIVTDDTAPQWLPSGDALLIDRVEKP
ncbi:MAG: TolB family protein [Actinomycetota bacterium]